MARFDFPRWNSDDDLWDHETGAPGIGIFASALQVWSALQGGRPTTVAEAAMTFNVDPLRIVEAVDHHEFMYLSGPPGDVARRVIEHDGE